MSIKKKNGSGLCNHASSLKKVISYKIKINVLIKQMERLAVPLQKHAWSAKISCVLRPLYSKNAKLSASEHTHRMSRQVKSFAQ